MIVDIPEREARHPSHATNARGKPRQTPPRHRQATSPTTNQRPITRQQRANPTPTTRHRQTPGPTGHCERTTQRNNHNPPKPRHNAQMESITATAADLPRHPRKQHNHAPIPMPDPTHHQSVQPPLPWNR